MRKVFSVIGLVLASIGFSACSGGTGSQVIRVPTDQPTINAALKAAHPGALILVSPGTYNESVLVDKNYITIRGTDRNKVILDGTYSLANGIQVVSNGVAVENLTVVHYAQNGVIFNGAYTRDPSSNPGQGNNALIGYRISYVTASNNGLYGIYAFAARDGQIDHSYASGNPDSGFYVGQCKPCNVVLTDNIAERNAIGYFGTNASEGVYVINSEFAHNRLGIAPNSQKTELLLPQEQTVVAGNWVHDNDDPQTPVISRGYFGGGIAVGAGTKNFVTKNLVTGHDGVGIEITPLNNLFPENNQIVGNILRGNRVDLVYSTGDSDARGNCFNKNTFATSSPTRIESVMPCGTAATSLPPDQYKPIPAPPGIDYQQVAPPSAQPSMSNATTRPRTEAVAPSPVDVDSLKVPVGR